MKKRWFMPLLAAAGAAAAAGIYLTNQIMYLKKKEDAFIQEREMKAKRWVAEDFDALPKERRRIASPFGYSISCLFISPYPTNKWVIFCHGITENKYNMIRHMNLFLELGFNAVLYDHRRHGESGGRSSSYGHYEKEDLAAVVDELKKRQGEDLFFGIHGESMGAATALLYAGNIRDDADFYVADCPFSTFEEQLQLRIAAMTKLPPRLILPLGDLFLKWRDGYRIKDVSPLEAVKRIGKPILFVHSEPDAFIPADMTKRLYETKPGAKQLFLAPKGGHAQSINENRQEYLAAVRQFLSTYFPDLD